MALMAGAAIPALIGVGLAVGGFESRPVAYALFALAGLWLILSCLYLPLRGAY